MIGTPRDSGSVPYSKGVESIRLFGLVLPIMMSKLVLDPESLETNKPLDFSSLVFYKENSLRTNILYKSALGTFLLE
jgi:hypothetical protein